MHDLSQRPTSASRAGSCTLVGAGPGDPELLTLKAIKAIQAATVLLVDDLVNDEVLQWARPDARILHVGKRGGCKSTPQAFIHKLMVMAVREGEQVVRLKGGDPFIFGRGGEEVAHLRAAGIDCQVINGITAGLAAVTSLGVPLTHRDHAQGVVFVTGHARADAAIQCQGRDKSSGTNPHDSLDWQALARSARDLRLTLVVYMGVAGAAHIQRQLLAGGLPARTPVAVVQHASMPQQSQIVSNLGQLVAELRDRGLGSPAVIVVGDVLLGLAQLARPDVTDEPAVAAVAAASTAAAAG